MATTVTRSTLLALTADLETALENQAKHNSMLESEAFVTEVELASVKCLLTCLTSMQYRGKNDVFPNVDATVRWSALHGYARVRVSLFPNSIDGGEVSDGK